MEALGINLAGIVSQAVNFLLLLTLLYIFAYKPILKLLDDRSQKIKASLDQAEKLRAESSEAEAAIAARLDEARREGQAIVANANQVAERIRSEAEESARREAETILARARAEIEAETNAARQALRQQFADLTILAAEKVIERSLDREAHRQLIEQTLADSVSRN